MARRRRSLNRRAGGLVTACAHQSGGARDLLVCWRDYGILACSSAASTRSAVLPVALFFKLQLFMSAIR